jgi:phytoene/squalene synthetase
MALGAAFQKINFLRDLQSDIGDLQRSYFPGFNKNDFNKTIKKKIEEDIIQDFQKAYQGVKRLPLSARFGVYVAYKYYLALFHKLRRANPEGILNKRIRISNHMKFAILLKAGLRNRLNML